MGGYAWVTLATSDSYSLGALVLAYSLRRVGTKHDLAVLITPGVTESMREKLAAVFTLVKEVNILDSNDKTNLALLARPELGITFTKIHCWKLTQYEKCVFVDADTLVVRNCDELFDREELSAAPDVGWPDCFNSGVFVYRPSETTYSAIQEFALNKGSFDGADQGLLNGYFSEWAHKDISKHLPFIYNMCSTASYSYLPAFKQFGDDVRIVHFIGQAKPWLQYFDTMTGIVHPPPGCEHLQPLLQIWWNLFCDHVHPQLSSVMATSNLSAIWHDSITLSTDTDMQFYSYLNVSDNTDLHPTDDYNFQNHFFEMRDPWENYDVKKDPFISKDVPESRELEINNFNNDNQYYEIIRETRQETDQRQMGSITDNNHDHNHQNIRDDSGTCTNNVENCLEIETVPLNLNDINNCCDNNNVVLTLTIDTNHCDPSPSTCLDPDNVATQNELTASSCVEITEEGLAGALSTMTLGEPRSDHQRAMEDHLRRQNWEQGSIDYLGQDSFDNILRKISQTLSTAPPKQPSPPRDPQRKTSKQSSVEGATEATESATRPELAKAPSFVSTQDLVIGPTVDQLDAATKQIEIALESLVSTVQEQQQPQTEPKKFVSLAEIGISGEEDSPGAVSGIPNLTTLTSLILQEAQQNPDQMILPPADVIRQTLDRPVPIQVAESVLQAEPKESVSLESKPLNEEIISSIIQPLRESVAATSQALVEDSRPPAPLAPNGNDPGLQLEELKPVLAQPKPAVPEPPTVTAPTPPTSPPIPEQQPPTSLAISEQQPPTSPAVPEPQLPASPPVSEPQPLTGSSEPEIPKIAKRTSIDSTGGSSFDSPDSESAAAGGKKKTGKKVSKSKSKESDDGVDPESGGPVPPRRKSKSAPSKPPGKP